MEADRERRLNAHNSPIKDQVFENRGLIRSCSTCSTNFSDGREARRRHSPKHGSGEIRSAVRLPDQVPLNPDHLRDAGWNRSRRESRIPNAARGWLFAGRARMSLSLRV
jgi:hypothetical protein